MDFNATFLFTIASFIVFAIVMNYVLYEPIKKIVEKRESYYDENNKIISENEKQGISLIELKTAKVADAKDKSKEEIAKFQNQSKEQKEKQTKEKKDMAIAKVTKYQQELEAEKHSIEGDINQNAEEISEIILSKLINGGKTNA